VTTMSWIALALFLAAYAAITTEVAHKTVVSLLGAAVFILAVFSLMAFLLFRNALRVPATSKARVMSFDERQAIQNRPLLAKSLGVLALVIAGFLLGLTHGHVPSTALIVVWASGALSAFIDNIPYVATMTPLIKDIGVSLGAGAILPLWWSLSLGACLGGNGTLIGASANVVAAGLAKKNGYPISFMDCTKYGALFTLMSLAVSTLYVWLRFLR
jgi:Na+/H+ antiporter NhaD/arsenite permease-like protein